MSDRVHKLVRSWLVQWAPEVRVHEVVPLGKGVSAEVYGAEYTTSRGRQRSALRLVPGPLNLCMRESMVLNRLHASGLPVPRCYGVKEGAGVGRAGSGTDHGQQCGMLLDWMPGQVVGRPQDIGAYASQLATLLVQIHQQTPMHGLPRYMTELNRLLRQARPRQDLAQVVEAIESHKQLFNSDTTMLHGDFWPGNVLFKRKQLTAVLDWADACSGPRQVDVSNARIELGWLWGEEAVQQFTKQYFAMAPTKAVGLACFDLVASLKPALRAQFWGLSERQLARLNETVRLFQRQALLTLGAL